MKAAQTIISIPILIFFTLNSYATSYTWNGTTSTAWGTGTNWTPNGVPGSGDNVTIVTTSNQPVYDGVAGVTNLTMTSGTLNLGGYQLNITGTATFNGGTINNGRVNATGGTSTFAGTTFGAVVWVNSGTLTFYNSVFNDSLLAVKTGSGSSTSSGKNKFNGYANMENTGSGTLLLALSYPDTFNTKVIFSKTGTGGFNINQVDYTSANNQTYNGDVVINNTGSSGTFSIGNVRSYFNGNIELNCTSTGGITFGNGINYLASGKMITVGSTGFTAGTLTLNKIYQQGTEKHIFSLPSNTTFTITNSNIKGVLDATAPKISFSYNLFQDSLHIVQNGAGGVYSYGKNKFNGYTKIENTGTGFLPLSLSYPDTFMSKVVFSNTGNGIFNINQVDYTSANNQTYNGDVVINNTGSSGTFSIGNVRSYFNGNIQVNCTSTGGITFGAGPNNLASGKTITVGSTGFTAGTLTLNKIIQAGTDKHVFNLPANTTFTINNSTIKGVLDATAPKVSFSYNLFQDSLHMLQNGAGGVYSYGKNKFSGYTKIENTNTGTFLMSYFYADTFMTRAVFTNSGNGAMYITHSDGSGQNNHIYNGDVEFNNTGSSGTMYLANKSFYFNGNVVVNCTSSGGITFGNGPSYLASGKTVSIGSSGFTAGTLTLNKIIQSGTSKHSFTFTGTGGISISASKFNGVVNAAGPKVAFKTSTFGDSLLLTQNGSGGIYSYGGNKCSGYTKIENTNTGTFLMSYFYADTFMTRAVFTNSGNGAMYITHSDGSGQNNHIYNGDVEFNNTGSSGTMYLANKSFYFNGNVVVNCTSSGGITFGNGPSYLASGKTVSIGSTGLTAGTISLNKIIQSGSAAVSLTATGSGGISTGNSTWGGNFTTSAPNIYSTGNNKFTGKAIFTKTSNTANTWSGGNKFSDSLVIVNTGTSYVLMANGVGADTLLGHVKLNNTSSGTIYAGYNYNNLYYGNINVSQNVNFANGSGVAILKGSAAQTFNRLDAGTTPTDFKKLTIDKTANSNTFTLNKPIAISSQLTLTKGKAISTSTNYLNLADNATVSGVSNDSYVDGAVRKTGNDAFTFPVGKNGYYRKIGISAPSSTTDAYTAEYFTGNSSNLHSHGSKDGTLSMLNRKEYWNLDRNTGTSTVSVTLSWDSATSCGIDNVTNVKVSVWDGSTWKDKGNTATTGNVYIGTVTSGSAIGTFGTYALGTSGTLTCAPYSYVWNGSTSTAWNTTTNWTPNGYPEAADDATIVTATNQPLYSGVSGVNNLTMTSGTLNLDGYTLPITGTAYFNGGTINNGTINAIGSSTTFAGTTFGAAVNVNSADIYNTGSNVFNNKVKITKTSNTANTWTGGNTFNDSLIITNTGTNYIRLANTGSGDTYASHAVFHNTSSGAIYPAYAGTNTFSGNITLKGSGLFELGKGGGSIILNDENQYIRNVNGSVVHSFKIDKPGDYTTMFRRLNISNDFIGKMW
ncbi:MAG: hypothetical protein POELPBGB_03608 [Bacteroidia bacterium]|nr:hypothetical protein [Bacteroidia bacterium]